MLFSNMIKNFILLFALQASITPLYADTNPVALPIEQQEPSNMPKHIEQIRIFSQNLELAAGMIFNVNTKYGQKLVDTLSPILSLCSATKELPETVSLSEAYMVINTLSQATGYLQQAVENGFEQTVEFNPTIPNKETATVQEIEAIYQAAIAQFNTLIVKIEESYQDVWATLAMHVQTQLNKLDTILQTINTNIANNTSFANKADIKKDIMDLRNTLRQIQKEIVMAGSNPQAVLGVYQVNKAIISYLKESQKYKFRRWAVIDLASELVRAQENQDQSMDELLFDIMQTNQELEKLEKEAEKIDLTIVNKTARFVGNYIVDPIQKYNLGLYALTAATTAGLGTYATYFFDQTFFTDNNSLFRKIFGHPNYQSGKMIHIPDQKALEAMVSTLKTIGINSEEIAKAANASSIALHEDHVSAEETVKILELLLNQAKRTVSKPMIPLAKIDEFISEHKAGSAAIGITLIGLATYCYYKIWKTNNETWSKKLSVWFNKLKGGSYAKMAEKFDDILSTITFDDIIGMEYEKALVYPHLKYIKDAERWDANELTPTTGILLTGPTRTGKTFFAKAICGELHKQNPDKNIKFISINAHDIKEGSINAWMSIAKLFAPCVLFIDEIDLLGLQRTKDATLLADFLQALSGVADTDPKKKVIVIGVTNKPENIDAAMVQSGRLALEIRFKYPNLQERKLFIEKRLNKFAIDPQMFDIDVEKLARETHGKSFEDIKLMMDNAFIHIGIKGGIISQEVLEQSIDAHLRKIIDIDSKEVANDEKYLLAAHFAGQALTHLLLDLDEKIAKVTIRQVVVKVKEESILSQFESAEHHKQTGLEQGAIFTYRDKDTLDIKTQSLDEIAKKAKTLLAGRIAERILTNTCSAFFGFKKNTAFNMIKSIVADGIDLKSLSKNGQNKINDDAQVTLKQFEQEVELLLQNHKPELIALVEALQKEQTLSAPAMKAIMQNAQTNDKSGILESAVAA